MVTVVDYEVEILGWRKEKRIYHVNLLKRWYPPASAMLAISSLAEEEGDIPLLSEGSDSSMISSIQWTTNQWLILKTVVYM